MANSPDGLGTLTLWCGSRHIAMRTFACHASTMLLSTSPTRINVRLPERGQLGISKLFAAHVAAVWRSGSGRSLVPSSCNGAASERVEVSEMLVKPKLPAEISSEKQRRRATTAVLAPHRR